MNVQNISHKTQARYDISYISALKIQGYGRDNLYPQRLRDIIASSPTACECIDRFAEFIEGNGIKDIDVAEMVVNRRGDTLDDTHKRICEDYAKFGGFALHIGYNMMGDICEVTHIPVEMVRLHEPDDNGYVAEVLVHPDWSGKLSRRGKTYQVNLKNCTTYPIYNPIKEVVMAQMQSVGGASWYDGQVLYWSNNGHNCYPTPIADRVVTEMSTDEGLANVKYRNVRNNFLPAGMIITRKGQDAPEDEEYHPLHGDDGFADVMRQFQGDINAGKLLEVAIESEDEEPIFKPMQTMNYDKAFDVTEKSVTERIYSAFGQEAWYCVRIGKTGFSGSIIADAFNYYNSVVSKHQRTIQRTLQGIFRHWYTPIDSDFSIELLTYNIGENATN